MMDRDELESLVGETMEDMGLVEHVEELECECLHCSKLAAEGATLCEYCRIEHPYCHH